MIPSAATLYAVVEATWPPACQFRAGPWSIRDGAGGGKRASAATAEAPVNAAEVAAMEAEMVSLGQTPLAMIRDGEVALDTILAAAGYAVIDPVVLYTAPVAQIAAPTPPLSAFAHWPRLAAAEEIWQAGGIGPGRLAVMDRVRGLKAALLARSDDTPSGAAFVAVHDGIAMIHSIEVAQRHRRKGAARHMMREAATWAVAQGATWFSLAVTERNAPARALYEALGMQVAGRYYYRIKWGPERPARLKKSDQPTALDLPAVSPLPDETQAYFDLCVEKLGIVPNVLKAYAFDIGKLNAFTALYNDLMLGQSGLPKLDREMIGVVVSAVNRCFYCLVAHGQAVRALSGKPELGEALVMNWRMADITPRQRAMLGFAEMLTEASSRATEADRQALRDLGFTDRDIWDIAAVAGFFNMTNRVASATDMRPNPEYHGRNR